MRTLLIALMLLPLIGQGANYSARKTVVDGIEVVQLADAAHKTEVSIAPSIGNMAYEMKVNGKNLLSFPFGRLSELKAKPGGCCIPFLAPWANRLDENAFWAGGRRYLLNPDLGNLRRDQNGNPIHGSLYSSSAWQVVSVKADQHSAWVVSRLEYWKDPDLMAQFPFAHTITITHRLAAGALQVETQIDNHSVKPMPVAVGFHPYFALYDSPRSEWTMHLPARRQVVLSDRLLPTGELRKAEYADPLPLAGRAMDDVLTDLERGADGRAVFWVKGKQEKISVAYGPKYQVGVVYMPPGRDSVCMEPMSAITNAFNLSKRGLYDALQNIPPGGQWKESFWVIPEGF